MKDLILLVADKNMHYALRGGLQRHAALGISAISFDFIVHPGRDGGVRRSGTELIALERYRFRHAIMMLDFDGSGASHSLATELEAELDHSLRSQWGDRAKAIVVDPEVDRWMWGADNAMRTLIGWSSIEGIRDWVVRKGFPLDDTGKPQRPKEALEAALRECRYQRTSALYEKIAARISLANCADAAFVRLRAQLQQWFGLVGS